jgi:hypothetical protein
MNTTTTLGNPSALEIANNSITSTLTLTRRKICKLAAAALEYLNNYCDKYDRPIVTEYLTAIRTLDYNTIHAFNAMGDRIHQSADNIRTIRQAKTLGFDTYQFNEYGWVEQYDFVKEEEVSLKVKGDNCYHNRFRVGQAPNGSWVYGYTITYGGAGEGSGLSIWNDTYPTKEACIIAVLQYFKAKFEKALTKNDSTNYKVAYCQHVLNLVNTKLDEANGFKRNKKGQLAMF